MCGKIYQIFKTHHILSGFFGKFWKINSLKVSVYFLKSPAPIGYLEDLQKKIGSVNSRVEILSIILYDCMITPTILCGLEWI